MEVVVLAAVTQLSTLPPSPFSWILSLPLVEAGATAVQIEDGRG